MSTVASAVGVRRSRVRLLIVAMLFLVTTVNYADRATLSIAGTALAKELNLDPVAMGYIFSAFGWSYVAAQVPGGWLLDRFGSLAFFGKGIGALGWAVVSDTSPKEAGGVSGGLFNTFGNLSSITTPIIIGYILAATGSFAGVAPMRSSPPLPIW